MIRTFEVFVKKIKKQSGLKPDAARDRNIHGLAGVEGGSRDLEGSGGSRRLKRSKKLKLYE